MGIPRKERLVRQSTPSAMPGHADSFAMAVRYGPMSTVAVVVT